ncbi:MAG: hypothetical protein Q9207_006309 [Kuettlingeria erythrocarpa]
MEALAAFSLVSGILQVLDVSCKAVAECREFYRDGSIAAHRDTGEIVEALATPPSRETLEILNLTRKCNAIARELHVEISKLKFNNSGRRRALLKAVQSIRKTRWLKEMQAQLNACSQTLDTLILIKLDTQSLRRSYDFETLDQKVRDLALKIERGSTTTKQLLADQTIQIQQHFDRRFDEREGRTQIDQARERFQASLFFADIEAREDEIVEAFEGTCKWIFDPPMVEGGTTRKWHNFRHWLEAGEGVYWISGKPGAGNSTAMKYIVDEPRTAQYLSEWERDTDLLIVWFFFKNLGTELQKSAVGLLRSLIWQITRDWPGMIESVLERYGNAAGQPQEPRTLTELHTWTEKRLFQVLKDFINGKPATVTLCTFIDGLDEYTGDEELLFDVIRLLSSASGCKVCVSSRPDQAFRREFQNYSQCRVQDLNQKDIEKMVIEKMKPCLEKNKPTETIAINRLVKELIHAAEGVFLWLSIMIKDLTRASNNGDSINELRDRLHVTPGTIYGLYRRILDGLDKSYLKYALSFFKILIATHWLDRGIDNWKTLLGLACAEDVSWMYVTQLNRSYFSSPTFEVTCRELRTRLNSRCGSLIEIGNIRDRLEETTFAKYCRPVSFIHRSVVEFLKEEYGSAFDIDACFSEAWIPIARANIGLMFLFPLTEPLNENYKLQAAIDGIEPYRELSSAYEGNVEDHESQAGIDGSESDEEQSSDIVGGLCRRLRYLIWCATWAVYFGGISDGKVHFTRSLDHERNDLTVYVLRTLRYMATKNDLFKTIDCKHRISIKRLLKTIVREFMDIHAEAQDLFQDGMSFAAFWGCESYIQSRFSPETSDEQVEAMFRSVVVGIYPSPRFTIDANGSAMARQLNIVEFLVQERQIPRGKTDSWRPHFESWWRASPWGGFFLHACGIPEQPRNRGFNLYGEEAAWMQRRLDLIKKFLALGADCNTRLSLSIRIMQDYSIDNWPGVDYDQYNVNEEVFVDESPLAYLQSLNRRENRDNISETATILRSEGAVERRRYRYWAYDDTYYRINSFQSKRLDEELRSICTTDRRTVSGHDFWKRQPRFEEGFQRSVEPRRIFDDIQSTNDQLNWDTLDKEWKTGDSNWLEEND